MHSPGNTNLGHAGDIRKQTALPMLPSMTASKSKTQLSARNLPVVVTSLAPISERFCRTDRTSFFLSSDLVASWSASWDLVMALALVFMALDFIADFIAGAMS